MQKGRGETGMDLLRIVAIALIAAAALSADTLSVPDTASAAPAGNSITIALDTAMKIYRRGITDLEAHSCPMRPSCSKFAELAFKKTNSFVALLLTADRLMRDNSFAKNHYPRDKKGKLIDPVERYLNWDKKQRPY